MGHPVRKRGHTTFFHLAIFKRPPFVRMTLRLRAELVGRMTFAIWRSSLETGVQWLEEQMVPQTLCFAIE